MLGNLLLLEPHSLSSILKVFAKYLGTSTDPFSLLPFISYQGVETDVIHAGGSAMTRNKDGEVFR